MDLRESDTEETTLPNSVLGKAQLLLGAFESGAVRLRLSELSRRSGVPKASAYRLAQELVQWGLLDRHDETYELGMRLFQLGERVPASAVLRSAARPLLTDLFARTRAAIHLAVLDETHVLFLEKIGGEASVRTHSQLGGRLPASCTATGKLLLALSPDGHRHVRHLAQGTGTGLATLTERSVVSTAALGRQLAAVRRQGFAHEVGEVRAGFASLAVPVAGPDGVVRAALSATAPVSEVSVERLLPALRSTAAAVTRGLTHSAQPRVR
ncbi:IclR family transcriptional regulator [Streptomyces sp. NPDC005356]|uniref:IclR family transcriptional regulator n=1 Tax=unclassified Streptomyces TaxID=2593676 RepID=UPI0033B61E5A